MQEDENNREFFAYGGDFGEDFLEPSGPLFMTNNGIVLPDLKWKPVAHEVKQAYRPHWFAKPDTGSAWQTTSPWNQFVAKCIHSGYGAFICTAALRENGVIVAEIPLSRLFFSPAGSGRLSARSPTKSVWAASTLLNLPSVSREKPSLLKAATSWEVTNSPRKAAPPPRLPRLLRCPWLSPGGFRLHPDRSGLSGRHL